MSGGCGIITNINCVSNELLEPELLSADVNLLSSPALQWTRSRFPSARLASSPSSQPRAPPAVIRPRCSASPLSSSLPRSPPPSRPPALPTPSTPLYRKVNNVTRSLNSRGVSLSTCHQQGGVRLRRRKVRYCETDAREARSRERHYTAALRKNLVTPTCTRTTVSLPLFFLSRRYPENYLSFCLCNVRLFPRVRAARLQRLLTPFNQR